MSLWRGEALAGLTFMAAAAGEVERLTEQRIDVTEELMEAELALGGGAALVPDLRELAAAHPYRERPRAQLMLALYRSGRQAEALAVYRDTRRLLAEELGLEPGPALRRMEHLVLTQSPELTPNHPPLHHPPAPAHPTTNPPAPAHPTTNPPAPAHPTTNPPAPAHPTTNRPPAPGHPATGRAPAPRHPATDRPPASGHVANDRPPAPGGTASAPVSRETGALPGAPTPLAQSTPAVPQPPNPHAPEVPHPSNMSQAPAVPQPSDVSQAPEVADVPDAFHWPDAPEPKGTRRLVTVLAANAASTAALDPELLHRVLDAHTRTCADVVIRHGGSVLRPPGRPMAGVFGLSEVREDDAPRAVRAAVELRDALRAWQAEVERDHGVTLPVRLGVESGEAYVPDDSPSHSRVPDGSPVQGPVPDASPVQGHAPDGSPVWGYVPDGSPVQGLPVPDDSPVHGHVPYGSPVQGYVPGGSPVRGHAPDTGRQAATGHVFEAASQLQQAAPDGGILIGGRTYSLVRTIAETEPHAAPVAGAPAWLLCGLRRDPPPLGRSPVPFVGRHQQLHQLRQTLQEVVADRACRLVTVIGPPGIGKSRLAARLLEEDTVQVSVVIVRCASYGTGAELPQLVRQIPVGGEERVGRAQVGGEERVGRAQVGGEERVGRAQVGGEERVGPAQVGGEEDAGRAPGGGDQERAGRTPAAGEEEHVGRALAAGDEQEGTRRTPVGGEGERAGRSRIGEEERVGRGLAGGEQERTGRALAGGERERGRRAPVSEEERVRRVLGVVGQPLQADEMFWAVRRLLERAAARRPLVVVVDDAQHAPPELLDLLDYLVACSTGAPILLLCLSRERRPSWSEAVVLGPLSEQEAYKLAENAAAGALDQGEVEAVVRVAEGNPFFLEQLVAAREETGTAALPMTVQAVLAARIDHLDPGERMVLQYASVEGVTFHWGAVAALVPGGARAALMSLVRKNLVRADTAEFADEDAFRFSHALIGEVAYDSLPKRTRADLHERIAGWLAGKAGAQPAAIGHHLESCVRLRGELGLSGERERALAREAAAQLAAAAPAALLRGDVVAGARLWRRAVALMPCRDPGRAALLPRLGAALHEAGRFEEAYEVLAEAISVGEPGVVALAEVERERVRLQAGTGWSLADARRVADRALGVLRGDDRGLCRAWCLRASIDWTEGRAAAADESWRHAERHAVLAGDDRELYEILGWRASAAAFGPMPVATALDLCARSRDRVAGSPAAMAVILHPSALLLAMRGEFGEARECLREADDILGELGRLQSAVSHHEAMIELLAGRPEQAETLLRAGYERLSEMGERTLLATTAAMLARALHLRGLDAEAEAACQVSARNAGDEDLPTQVMWRGVQAGVLAAQGRDGAVDMARDAVRLAQRTDLSPIIADALFDLAVVLYASGAHEQACTEARRSGALHERKGNTVSAGHVRAWLAARSPSE
ncbi:BTAD domain-containing putative transcriptional regulator [[Actinomadura] parvosata]|uniref:BTAD domain-containing putative transcriptional regulator n=1 Tax=[Actinomadura] parvosata TaxID=1955412 RepID=UPI003B97403B